MVRNYTLSNIPNVTHMLPANDEALRGALQHLIDTFGRCQATSVCPARLLRRHVARCAPRRAAGSFANVPGYYNFTSPDMVLAVRSLTAYVPELDWLTITVLPAESYVGARCSPLLSPLFGARPPGCHCCPCPRCCPASVSTSAWLVTECCCSVTNLPPMLPPPHTMGPPVPALYLF